MSALPPGAPASPPAPAPPASARVRLPLHPARITYVFLGLIGAVFLAQLGLQQVFGTDVVIALGAKVNGLIAQGEVWRLLTAVFIHAGILHIAFNAYALYNIGSEVEATYGPLRFSLLFLLTGLSGTILSMLFNPHPSVGASGAVFGLIGAEAVFLYRHRRMLGERGRHSLQNIVVIAVLNLILGLQGNIDNWGHAGGLLGGLILGWLIGPVWAVARPGPDPAAPQAVLALEDQHPLNGAGWLAVSAFGLGLAGLTGLAIALQR